MIVITLSKTPNSLRGDLTKWCQEIQTGVYVGNVNAKVRDQLWDRVKKNIGGGEATLVYNTNNELGYTFRTNRRDREVIDYDGIPFLMHINSPSNLVLGFSNASKFHKAHRMKQNFKRQVNNKANLENYVAIDLETTGLDVEKDKILSIAAVKCTDEKKLCSFYKLIKLDLKIPNSISKLTGLTDKQLQENGVSLKFALSELKNFIGTKTIIGYNLPFDISFLNKAFKQLNIKEIDNRVKDLLPIVKRKNKFLDDYHLNTVLSQYGIENLNPHHAKSDATCTWYLAEKLL